MYFKTNGTSWVVISAGRVCSAYLGRPVGGSHHWGKAGSEHVHCPLSRHLSTDYVDNDDDLHNIVRQARRLVVDMSRHLFANLFSIFSKETRGLIFFWIPVLCGYFGGWHSSTRFPHSRSNLLRYTRTTQRKFHQCEEFSLKVGTGKRDGGDGENKYFSVLIRGNSVRSRSLQSLC